ncbi:MAG: hypothetical protein OEQ29_10540 [Alphaproteobacteria bacterium]|nr:hypothetical protein [Alphaproteobacteria bacterium]MDH5534687.1 hypothetical protein [Betaproteobacteria bacterium]
MTTIRLASWLTGFAVLYLLATAGHALDDAGAKAVVSKFLASQKSAQGDPSAAQHVISDLNGDGKPDVVLLWNILGPTYFLPKLTILLDQGKTYRALTTDLTGQTEKVTVAGSLITVDTLTLGPRDPRCCPTVRKQLEFRWAGGKLTAQK